MTQQAHTITRDEYDALHLTRPLTDPPIGATTTARRHEGAKASEVFAEAGVARPGWKAPAKAERTESDCDHCGRTYDARHGLQRYCTMACAERARAERRAARESA